jgi:hypothetical protein
MNKNNRVFVTFAICLQVFILLFATTAIPAAAEAPLLPSQIAYLFGDVVLDGKPAPVGVEITAKLNGNVVGTTVVEQAGVYGDKPLTMLLVTCDPKDYGDVKFYVNGLESQTVGENTLENGSPGNEIKIDLIAESPADSSGGSSGGSPGTSNEDTAEPGGSGDDTGVNQQDTQPPEEISSSPDSESAGSKDKSSTTILILAVVIVIAALVALYYAKNKGL